MYTINQILFHALQTLDMQKMANHALIENNETMINIYIRLLKRKLRTKRNAAIIRFLYHFDILTTEEAEKLGLYIPTMKGVICPF